MGFVGRVPWATHAIFFAAKLHRDTGVCFAVISLSVVLHLGCNLLVRNKRNLVCSVSVLRVFLAFINLLQNVCLAVHAYIYIATLTVVYCFS